MGSAYGLDGCVGWYRAAAGVFADAGTTPAANGDAVAQWNDVSGAGNHLTQSEATARPVFNAYRSIGAGTGVIAPFGGAMNLYGVDEPAAVLFDGSSTWLELPGSLMLGSSGGASVILCTRGVGWMPIGFGDGGGAFVGYGFVGGSGQMGFAGSQVSPFPKGTMLSAHLPMVHGFVADDAASTMQLFMGTSQTDMIAGNCLNFAAAGGTLGRMPGSSGAMGSGFFSGEILELAVFDVALTADEVRLIVGQMQDANGIRSDASTNLLAFLGDSQTTGGPAAAPVYRSYPYWLSRAYGGACKAVQLAELTATCSQQLAAVQNVLAAQDRLPFTNVVAICCCGAADIAGGSSDVQTQAEWIALAQAIKAIAGVKLLAVVPIHQDGASTLTPQSLQYFHNFQNWLRGSASDYADAVVDWSADERLANGSSDPTYWADEFHTTETGDRVKAALLKPALDRLLGTTPAPAGLQYGAFYASDRSYAGAYGNFVKV